MGGGFERLHYLLESAFDPDGQLSITFLRVHPCSAPTSYPASGQLRIHLLLCSLCQPLDQAVMICASRVFAGVRELDIVRHQPTVFG